MVRCGSCVFRQSDLTSSDKLSRVYSAQEEAEDRLGAWDGADADEARGILTDLAEAVREVGEEYQESADNIMESFPSGNSTSEECEEKASGLEDWADTCESAADDIEDFDEAGVEPEPDESKEDAVVRAREAWAEEVRSNVEGAIVECPL